MPLPRGDEYLTAVQNPRTAFSDNELKECIAETDRFGIPKPYSGGFTTTFHLINNNKHWAVRCFTRVIQDLQKRYEAIGKFLDNNSEQFFVKATCINQGIKVRNQWYPIIKMQWIEGETLDTFIEQNLKNRNLILNIRNEFVDLVKKLEKLKIAHGDLQHGNLIVKNNKLYLIDYDGLYLPALSYLPANEIGHVNYQHPARGKNHYNEKIDRFSSIVIYLGLTAIYYSPELWKRYSNSDNILFSAKDFREIDNSPLINDLSTINSLIPYVERFKRVCKLDYDKIPSLEEFVSGNFKYQESEILFTPYSHTPNNYIVLDASEKGSLKEHIGERVVVVGKITDYHSSTTVLGDLYFFLNFGNYPNQTFTLVLWSEAISKFKDEKIDPRSFINKWVSVIGIISVYRNRPQMIIERPTQIQILPSTEEAQRLLGRRKLPSKPIFTKTFNNTQDETIFNTLYSDSPKSYIEIESFDVVIFNNLYSDSPPPISKKKQNGSNPSPKQSKTQVKSKSDGLGCGNVLGLALFLGIIGGVIFGPTGFIVGFIIGIIWGWDF